MPNKLTSAALRAISALSPPGTGRTSARRALSRVGWSTGITLLVASAISACGSSASGNDVASRSPDAIVHAAYAALEGVSAVHVSGSVADGATSGMVDLNLVPGKGARGEMSEGGLRFQFVEVGQFLYIKGSNAFLNHFGGPAAVQLLRGRWLKAPSNASGFSSLARLINVQRLTTELLSGHGALAKGATTTIDGQKVVEVRDTSTGGILYVATTGKPYPIEIQKSDSQHVTFDRVNQPVSLTAPNHPVPVPHLAG